MRESAEDESGGIESSYRVAPQKEVDDDDIELEGATEDLLLAADEVQEEEDDTASSSMVGFWLMGLLNNASFVIMIAAAKSISDGGVALVFIAATFPGMLIELTAPFWFERVPYELRMAVAALLMFVGFALVGPLSYHRLETQLLGVGLASVQCALGQGSMLALSSRYPNNGVRAVASWSSGTGVAGIVGYAWVAGLTQGLGLHVKTAIALAMLTLPVAYLATYEGLLGRRSTRKGSTTTIAPRRLELSARGRLAYAWSLWPITGAIFAVYFAEYAMQAGVWAAMGMPSPARASRRAEFYEYSNWLYQAGVACSRSSALLFEMRWLDRTGLWLMSLTQFLVLTFFSLDAAYHWWYDSSILALCFVVGLLGGAVYVHGFRILSSTGDEDKRELAMPVGAFAADAGVALSEIAGLLLQGCLYEANHIAGATAPITACRRLHHR